MQDFVFVPSASRRQPSVFMLFTLTMLAAGILLIGVGLAFLLFAPLLIASGAALLILALLALVMLLLVRGLRWIVDRFIKGIRQTAFSQALAPVLQRLARQLAARLVSILIAWLDQNQGNGQPMSNARKKNRSRQRRHRPLLFAHAIA